MDLCSMFYLEPDPGYAGSNITDLSDPWMLEAYIDEHVEITGEEVWCVECGAINVQSIEIISDLPDFTVTNGILWENTGGSDCMDGCDEFGIDPDDGFDFQWVTTFGEPELLQPFIGQHVEFLGIDTTCVECSALYPGYVNIRTDDNLVQNSSFEFGGEPELDNWPFPCFGDPDPDAPIGGGLWSLKLESGNTQGCFPGTATSALTTISEPGDILQVSGWMHQTYDFVVASFRLTPVNDPGLVIGESGTDALDWTLISFTDTVLVNENTSLQIVLDAGMTGGPAVSWAFFDQIVVQKTGQMLKGDVNADNEINILDIVGTVTIIISAGDGSTYELWAADFNMDENVNVLDVVQMVNTIVGG